MNNEIIIKENRGLIIIVLFCMLVFTPTVGLFLYMLLQDVETLSFNFHVQFMFLVTIMIIGTKDCLIMLFTLITKFISPYYIKISRDGIYDCKLKQCISWNKIEKIEYLDYKKSFYNKNTMFEYVLYMLITGKSLGIIVELVKTFILVSSNAKSNIPVICTRQKKELLKKASFLKKIESLFLPDNMIKINIDYDLTATEEDLLELINKIRLSRYSNM